MLLLGVEAVAEHGDGRRQVLKSGRAPPLRFDTHSNVAIQGLTPFKPMTLKVGTGLSRPLRLSAPTS